MRGAERLALVVGSPARCQAVRLSLAEDGWKVRTVPTVDSAFDELDVWPVDLVVVRCDAELEPLRRLRASGVCTGRIPVVVVSASGSLSLATRAGRLGASDVIADGPSGPDQLAERAAELVKPRRPSWPVVLRGRSEGITRVRERIDALADLTVPVTIEAEPGEDRRAVAIFLHRSGPLGTTPFTTLASESIRRCAAHGDRGTIYLEEVETLTGEAGRYWHELIRCSEHMGTASPMRVVVGASQDVRALADDGALDRNLADSLARFRIALPPLIERQEDLEDLVAGLLAEVGERFGCRVEGVTGSALDRLAAHPWSGTLFELRQVVEALAPLARSGRIDRVAVDAVLAERGTPLARIAARRAREERQLLLKLYAAHGTYSGVARVLGITRNAVKYRFAKHNLLGKRAAAHEEAG